MANRLKIVLVFATLVSSIAPSLGEDGSTCADSVDPHVNGLRCASWLFTVSARNFGCKANPLWNNPTSGYYSYGIKGWCDFNCYNDQKVIAPKARDLCKPSGMYWLAKWHQRYGEGSSCGWEVYWVTCLKSQQLQTASQHRPLRQRRWPRTR